MYYNEILHGKTGRHDVIIQDLKDLLVYCIWTMIINE